MCFVIIHVAVWLSRCAAQLVAAWSETGDYPTGIYNIIHRLVATVSQNHVLVQHS